MDHADEELPVDPPVEEVYPSCQTTLWEIGQWRCEYWRPEGRWRGSSLRLFRGGRLVRTVGFGLHAQEQSRAWRAAVVEHPTVSPPTFVDADEDGLRSRSESAAIGTTDDVRKGRSPAPALASLPPEGPSSTSQGDDE